MTARARAAGIVMLLARGLRQAECDIRLVAVDEHARRIDMEYRLDSTCDVCVLTSSDLQTFLTDSLVEQLGPDWTVRLAEMAADETSGHDGSTNSSGG